MDITNCSNIHNTFNYRFMATLTSAILYIALVFVVMLIIKVANDYYAKNYAHRIINHGFSAWMDVIFYAVASSYFINDYAGLSNCIALTMFLMLLSFRWLLFDAIFNVINNNTLMHVGKSAWLDKLMQPLSEISRLFVKLFLISVFIILFIQATQ